MNKKGFTLVELIVSITLISIVLVSMTATLISLRTAYSRAYEDSDVLVYSSSISRVLNLFTILTFSITSKPTDAY